MDFSVIIKKRKITTTDLGFMGVSQFFPFLCDQGWLCLNFFQLSGKWVNLEPHLR